ncbi:minor capsid protein [Cellulosilyticum sp. I15G10I2]|uniref:minor capsid protein n=1 Tax=Cellulosilyticum sp. I15G10I2 TaxID=1892843 RepID=UPI00085C171F|nr:minor capsid protein [Cellulosilyticum sp. I15G10I2]
MSNYWQERLLDDIYNKNTKALEKKVISIYKQANKSINNEITKLWLSMLEDGEISASTLYKMNRFRALQDTIQRELYKLGTIEQEYIQSTLLDSYKQSYIGTNDGYNLNTSLTIFNDNIAKNIVNANFKGAVYSDRIWLNKDKLREQIEKSIINTAITGQDVRKASRAVRDRFGVAYSDAERLIRTENMRVLNSGQMKSYIDNGYEKYRILASLDSRTSDICKEQNGNIYNFSEAIQGVNYPPFHVNCRSIAVPVIN